jgi:octaprenyl-diphosphate synthase
MIFDKIKEQFNPELIYVNNFIHDNLNSDVELINDISEYIMLFGGKKIRPLITILFGKMFKSDINSISAIASAIELIHTATLLHDDVVDMSEKRRNKTTVNNVWGNKESILVGDFLYTKAFQMMVKTNNFNILKLMSDTTNIMSEGEIIQLINKNNILIKESDYFKIIRGKTAQLFSAASSSGGIISNIKEEYILSLSNYGLNLGIAYQLIDDMLDYSTTDKKFGKNICDDIIDGTYTMPFIHYINSNEKKKKKIIKLLRENNKENFLEIKNLILNSDSIEYTFNLSLFYANKAENALMSIPKNEYTHLAKDIIKFIINRQY